MQAIRLRTTVTADRRLDVVLPPEAPEGEVEAVILYEDDSRIGIEEARRRHLMEWIARIRQHSPNRSREDIDRQTAEERDAWGE